MKVKDCLLLLVVLCLMAGSEERGGGRGGGGRSGRRGGIRRGSTTGWSSSSGSHSSSTGKISYINKMPVKAQPPPGFYSNYPGHLGAPPSYGWNVGPPPPYPGTRTGQNFGWNVGPPPPYPGLSGGLSSHAPPPYPGYPSGYRKYNHGGLHFVNGILIGHSLSSLSRDVRYHHFYYPHSRIFHTRNNYNPAYTVEHVNTDGTKSYSSYFGNMTCVLTYNVDSVSKWANETLRDFYKSHPHQSLPLLLNDTSIGLNISGIITQSTNFTIIQGEIIRNETFSVTCCGTDEGQVNLNKLISGQYNSVNCVYNSFIVPFRKLKFIPVTNSTNTNSTITSISSLKDILNAISNTNMSSITLDNIKSNLEKIRLLNDLPSEISDLK